MRPTSFLHILAFAATAAAHPGHDHAAEAAVRREFLQHSKRDLSHCAEHLESRGHIDRQIARRQELLRSLQLAQGLERRAPEDINKSHHSDKDYSLDTAPEVIFSGNNSCVLNPEVTEGPYYVGGEYVRTNIIDGEPGVPLYVNTLAIDVNTCEPVSDIHVEIWHCNATGVYGGVVADSNGNPDDKSNLDKTFGRGIQPTDSDGISLFQTIFPGHYTGRTTHIHVMTYANATMMPNGTIMNSHASHVGQMYFDQDLINEVETNFPYTENTQVLTLNAEDSILAEEAASSDPLMNWVYLGDEASDGILAWLSFGIDTTFTRNVSAAAHLYKEGGVMDPDSGGAPGGGPPGEGPPGDEA